MWWVILKAKRVCTLMQSHHTCFFVIFPCENFQLVFSLQLTHLLRKVKPLATQIDPESVMICVKICQKKTDFKSELNTLLGSIFKATI